MPLTRRTAVQTLVTASVFGVAGCLGSSNTRNWDLEEKAAVTNAQQYNAPGCGCCKQYASYLRNNIDGELTETVPDDIVSIKEKYNIPESLHSCHTLVLEDYVVEGHVPAQVVAKLLTEKPAIEGVALPGMPAGTPGMGGTKQESWTIYVIGGDQAQEKYVEI
uniref:DUF411 domain-containing protein n=1 Tax=Haloprofundus sp. MHR1 TaxID=2572921 RepID=UPI001F376766|nr:DUF411 domain-containing protein [Haloprofundus sp. MHR1]